YYRGQNKKAFYFNYIDILEVNIIPDKKGDLHSVNSYVQITFLNGSKLSLDSDDFCKENIKDLLYLLKEKTLSSDNMTCSKPTGNIGNVNLTHKQKKACTKIITTASISAGGVGAGLAQVPLADSAVITPIQIGMIVALGRVFDIRVSESAAKGIIGSVGASIVGRGTVQLVLGWVPLLGNIINTATAAGLTEAIGWIAVAHFYNLQQQDKAKYKVDGMKEGYNAASKEYEKKMHNQAEEFMKQKDLSKRNLEHLNQLIYEYEEYIKRLEKQQKDRGASTSNLSALKEELKELKNIKLRISEKE
uniref:YcjF family protein n=1 Tax=Eubacterium ventriosum TaxID=39496 RepID=UPI003AB25A15